MAEMTDSEKRDSLLEMLACLCEIEAAQKEENPVLTHKMDL